MGDSRTDDGTGTGIEANAETAALREQLTLARDRLAERDRQLVEQERQLAELDRQIAQRDQQLAEQERQLAELREKITLLFDMTPRTQKVTSALSARSCSGATAR